MKLDRSREASCGSLPQGACGGRAADEGPPPASDHGEVTGEIAQWIENPLR